jgi:signal transduction histidine kinase
MKSPERDISERRTVNTYGRALERVSEALTHHRRLDAIGMTVRSALINVMGLRRVYFMTHKNGELRRHALGLHPRASDEGRLVLPERMSPQQCAPFRRALETRRPVSAHDSVAVAARSNGSSPRGISPDRRYTEARFWSCFGVEAIVPLTLGSRPGETRVVGLLALGPKVTDRPLDSEDHAMLSTLANQAAVAVESCMAFEEIRRLNESLEQQVRERTSELSLALDELKAAQGRLVESEMQAVLGRLVAGILHEVNSPLGTLRSSLDTIERALARSRPVLERHPDAQSPEVRRARAAVETSVELSRVLHGSEARIREVLDSLRRFVSLDVAEVMPLNLARSIGDVLTLLTIDERIRVETDFPDEPLVVHCKPARINKVFLNLLQNAVAGIDGPGEIRVRAERLGERVAVTIEDTGRGIPPAQLAQIFDFGFTTKSGGRVGMRMGLPTSKRWVEEGGGRLSIRSAVGRGTTVRVELPTRPPRRTALERAVAARGRPDDGRFLSG